MRLSYIWIVLLIGMVAVLPIDHAFALADPDVVQIDAARRYNDVAMPGDMFITVEYTIIYTVPPAESISEGWLGRLVDVGGLGQLASLQPFSGGDIPDLGYSQGVYGFYFPVTPSIAGTLRVTLEGNPTLSPTPAGVFTEAIALRNASDLPGDLRQMALQFENTWDVDLISPIFGGVNRYTEAGEHYFASALPNLRDVAPDMFILHSTTLDTPDRTFDTAYTDSREALFDGTPVGTGLEYLAIFLNVSEGVARFILALALAGVVAIAINRTPGIRETGFASTLFIWSAYLCMMGGFWMGLVNASTLGVLTVLAIMATAIVFFLQRTNA